ncbi:hypothetical protein DEF23_20310 [Marinitenerispora sediminis]|uniref:Uncharacterized protein n=1 Tax=Marinitenerispora sediminis TaxID=1931232 RepID=A0A368T1K6_9ACTN|nr:hypothetical protein DEF28_21335 [Marinitenerispora sediminis]RCV51501.1 hypothetical protein DEF23_20310 [Marinitenerispora sediminis]RCV53855.1 hypothetical protein DEF24_20005 [Marinitenerispora sediminis]
MLCSAALLAACAAGGGGRPPLPETSEGVRAFAELEVPESAGDLDIAAAYTDRGTARYQGSFTTGHVDAMAFCGAEGMTVVRHPETDVPEDTRERLGIEDDGVTGYVVCAGARPDAPRLRREVVVVYAPGTVRVYFRAEERPPGT